MGNKSKNDRKRWLKREEERAERTRLDRIHTQRVLSNLHVQQWEQSDPTTFRIRSEGTCGMCQAPVLMITFKESPHSARLNTCSCIQKTVNELLERTWVLTKRLSEMKELENNVIIGTAVGQLTATLREFSVDDRAF